MDDEYLCALDVLLKIGLPVLEYVDDAYYVIEFLDKTRWSSESLTKYHVRVCGVVDMCRR